MFQLVNINSYDSPSLMVLLHAAVKRIGAGLKFVF